MNSIYDYFNKLYQTVAENQYASKLSTFANNLNLVNVTVTVAFVLLARVILFYYLIKLLWSINYRYAPFSTRNSSFFKVLLNEVEVLYSEIQSKEIHSYPRLTDGSLERSAYKNQGFLYTLNTADFNCFIPESNRLCPVCVKESAKNSILNAKKCAYQYRKGSYVIDSTNYKVPNLNLSFTLEHTLDMMAQALLEYLVHRPYYGRSRRNILLMVIGALLYLIVKGIKIAIVMVVKAIIYVFSKFLELLKWIYSYFSFTSTSSDVEDKLDLWIEYQGYWKISSKNLPQSYTFNVFKRMIKTNFLKSVDVDLVLSYSKKVAYLASIITSIELQLIRAMPDIGTYKTDSDESLLKLNFNSYDCGPQKELHSQSYMEILVDRSNNFLGWRRL